MIIFINFIINIIIIISMGVSYHENQKFYSHFKLMIKFYF
jgi:hypothetical protein